MLLFLSSQERLVKRECLWVFGFGLHRIGQFALEIVDSGKFIPVPGLPQSTGVKTKLQAAHT